MMQKPWFKIFIWIITTAFFFLSSSIIISMLSPGPSEDQVMKFTGGMMDAMSNSTMGLSMAIEGDYELQRIIGIASELMIPFIIAAVILGVYVRIRKENGRAGQ